MSKASGVIFGFIALAVIVVLALGLTTERPTAFTLGVTAAGAVAELKPGQEACQAPIAVPDGDAAFDRVVVTLGTYRRPGPPVSLTIVGDRTNTSVASGRLAAGYPDITRAPTHTIKLDRLVDTRTPLKVCLRNDGQARVAVYGNGDAASRTSTASIDGKPAGVDLSLVFDRPEPRSTLSLLPAIFERASLWRASWVGGWFFWLLAAAIVFAVPALLARALRDASRT